MMTFDDMSQFPLGFKYFLLFKMMTFDDRGEGGSKSAEKMMMSYMTAP